MLRGLLGGAFGALTFSRRRRTSAQAAMIAPGGTCSSTDDCLQTAGEQTIVCGDYGIATDGNLNCCRNLGGACASGSGCCGVLECVGGVCLGGDGSGATPGGSVSGLPVGSPCTVSSQCLSAISGTVICASNNVADDGELNCCLLVGGACGGFDESCCGDLLCQEGLCAAPTFGGLMPGETCTANLECSQAEGPAICGGVGTAESACCRLEVSTCGDDADCCGALVCGDNLIAADGALTCCGGTGEPCGSDAACCGNNYCIEGTCQPLI